jgi:hypothetical protein
LEYLRRKILAEPSQVEIDECGGSRTEATNCLKMSFFLNLYNFMVLYNFTLLLISNPDAIE